MAENWEREAANDIFQTMLSLNRFSSHHGAMDRIEAIIKAHNPLDQGPFFAEHPPEWRYHPGCYCYPCSELRKAMGSKKLPPVPNKRPE